MADVILVVGAVVGMFVPDAGVPIGFVGVILVLAVRGSGAKVVRAGVSGPRRVIGRARRRDSRETTDS